MAYVKGIFKNRPNRFIAEVEVNGEMEKAHVPNTGRCRELLVPDCEVYLLPSDNPNRKTRFTLHFVMNRGCLVSLYSQEANSIVFDAIQNDKIKELQGYSIQQREKTIDDSRIDIYLANENEECYVEVKGVTLVVDRQARFPDAPTERGTKHLKELMKLKREGKRAVAFFLIQHPLATSFAPNWENDPKFSQTLADAEKAGVEILVYKTENTLDGIDFIPEKISYDLLKKII